MFDNELEHVVSHTSTIHGNLRAPTRYLVRLCCFYLHPMSGATSEPGSWQTVMVIPNRGEKM